MCKDANAPVSTTYPTLDELKKALPPVCFQKSLFRSLVCMCTDFGLLAALMVSYAHYLEVAGSWLPLVSAAYWATAGFVMWWIAVIGHDCGHSTFSNYTLVNDLCGNLCHDLLLMPYWPWQRSHHRHHLHHSHETEDYSWVWMTDKKLNSGEDLGMYRYIQRWPLLRILYFPIMMHLYLTVGQDGNHFYPFRSQRMWKDSSSTDRAKCVASAVGCGVYVAAMSWWLGTWQRVVAVYLVPVMVFGMWMVLVTYLQHHETPSQVYEEGDWTFVKGAFLTLDRTYGWGVDKLHHRISDCHVIHHLFFRQIPHYRLREATDALVAFLENKGLRHLYRHEHTPNFLASFLTIWGGQGLSAEPIKCTKAVQGS